MLCAPLTLEAAFVPRNRDLEAPFPPEHPTRIGHLAKALPIVHHN